MCQFLLFFYPGNWNIIRVLKLKKVTKEEKKQLHTRIIDEHCRITYFRSYGVTYFSHLIKICDVTRERDCFMFDVTVFVDGSTDTFQSFFVDIQ